MRVAVLFTGALRTIEKTMRYFKQNVVLGPDVHVYACLQNQSDRSNASWSDWLRAELGDNLKNVDWFSQAAHPEWFAHRDILLTYLLVSDEWKKYLRDSGSIVEYAQLMYAYLKMSFMEQFNGERYDYILRVRTDTIFAKPIDFHWLHWSEEDVARRLDTVRTALSQAQIPLGHDNIIKYFMNTIISDDLISNVGKIFSNWHPNRSAFLPSVDELRTYIKNGDYILTVRANNLYICRRNLFSLIPSLGVLYGQMRYPGEDDYWFNAENQFRGACYNSDLTIFDYSSLFEEKSLYEYDAARYFDADFNLLRNDMLYCVVRH